METGVRGQPPKLGDCVFMRLRGSHACPPGPSGGHGRPRQGTASWHGTGSSGVHWDHLLAGEGGARCKVARGVLPSPGMAGPQCWPHGDRPACRGVTPSHAAPARLHHLEHSAAPVACPRGGGQACPHTGAAAQGGLWGEQGPRTPSSRLLRPPGVKGPGAHCVFRGGQSPVLAITGAPIRRDPPLLHPLLCWG